jgi:hypothetical protein
MADARLLDPAALDEKRTPRGRISIVVPRAWLRDGARLEVEVPARLRCDLCDGGGCDACARSGGYRAPEPRIPIAITLPRVSDDHLALRVTNPFGDGVPDLLIVHVAGADLASPGVRYVGPNHDVDPVAGPLATIPKVPAWLPWAILIALAALAGWFAR